MNKEQRIRTQEKIQEYKDQRNNKLGLLFVNYGIMILTFFTIIIPFILLFVVIHLHKSRSYLQQRIDDLELSLLK